MAQNFNMNNDTAFFTPKKRRFNEPEPPMLSRQLGFGGSFESSPIEREPPMLSRQLGFGGSFESSPTKRLTLYQEPLQVSRQNASIC
jgi:hypothetical protein